MTYFRTKLCEGIAENLTSCWRYLLICACFIAAILLQSGCSKPAKDYKKQADEDVYRTIGSTWKQTGIEKIDYDIEAKNSDVSVSIENQLPPSGILTLPNAVNIAITHNRQYQTEKENLYIRALDLTLIRHEYEPNPFAMSRIGYMKDSSGELAKSRLGFENKDASYSYSRDLDGFVRDTTNQFLKKATVPPNVKPDVAGIIKNETSRLLATGTQIDMDNLGDAENFASQLTTRLLEDTDAVFEDIDGREAFERDTADDGIDHLSIKKTKIDGEDKVEAISRNTTYGFSRLLATGTQISTSVAFAWVDILTGDFRSGLTTLLTAAVRKPLLRGSSRKIVMEKLTQAQRDTLYQIRTFSRFRKEFVVSIITNYYRLLLQHDLVENARINYSTLNETYTQMEIFVSNGRLPKHELEQAHQDRIKAWDIAVKQEKLYQQMLDDFKIAMSIAPTDNFKLDLNELDILANKSLSPPSFTADQAIQAATISRLDLMNTADAIKDAERKVIVSKDLLRAELNLLAVAKTKPDFTTMKNKGSSIDMGLELDLPADRKAERNQYRKALIVLDRQKRNHAQATDNIKHAIRQAYRNLTNAAEIYRLQQDSLKLAAERFKSTSLLIQYNRANTRDVLDAQKDLFEAKNASTAALVDYTIAMLNFYRDTGVLEVKPDGIWQIPKTVDKPVFASDNLPSLRKHQQTNSSEDAIKNWMKSQTAR